MFVCPHFWHAPCLCTKHRSTSYICTGWGPLFFFCRSDIFLYLFPRLAENDPLPSYSCWHWQRWQTPSAKAMCTTITLIISIFIKLSISINMMIIVNIIILCVLGVGVTLPIKKANGSNKSGQSTVFPWPTMTPNIFIDRSQHHHYPGTCAILYQRRIDADTYIVYDHFPVYCSSQRSIHFHKSPFPYRCLLFLIGCLHQDIDRRRRSKNWDGSGQGDKRPWPWFKMMMT